MELDDSSPLKNPLATKPIVGLMVKFGIPVIISFLVNAMYNIVDQIFIGQGVGILGNAATNVAFPFTTIATSIALLLGIGSASNFNLNLGAGNREKAARIAGTGITSLAVAGVAMGVLSLVFLEPLLRLFGSSGDVLPYALSYSGIVAFGFPLVIFSSGCSQLIRADGSPTFSMLAVLSGAILNTILDPIFIFGLDMGMAGAALATVLGQLVSALVVLWYMIFRFKTFRITRAYLRPRLEYFTAITALGAAACFNQLAMTVVQIAMNNTLQHYGALSPYGSDIPLACVGVITKVNIVYMAFILGISQGCQPIFGFNYGAKIYSRVRKTYLTAAVAVTAVSCAAFLCFQFFPRPIINIFGQGNELYYQFAERYFRIYMFMIFASGLQPLTANFFTSIGKAHKGILMSLTRQVIFLLPLILIFPLFMGIDGVMYAGPIADTAAVILSVIFMIRELRKMAKLPENPGLAS